MTRFEELFCSSDMAKAVLSMCDLGRNPVAAFIYDWQTLISGGLAVLAALGTVVYLRRQIALQQEQVDPQRNQYRQENRQKVKTAPIGVPPRLSISIPTSLVALMPGKQESPITARHLRPTP